MKHITYKISHFRWVTFVQIISRLSLVRFFSSNVYEPYLYYSNADHSKLDILKDNKGKSGIYMWTNLMNNKSYIENYINLNQIEPVLGRYTFKKIGKPKEVKTVKQRTSHTVEVTDLVLSKVNIYPSVGSAARVLGVRQASISLYLKENRRNPFKNRYIFKLIIG